MLLVLIVLHCALGVVHSGIIIVISNDRNVLVDNTDLEIAIPISDAAALM